MEMIIDPESKMLTASVDWIEDVSIQLTAEITAANQTVTVNKYFANAHTIDWGDGTPVTTLSANTLHTYATTGSYTITLAFTGGAGRWTFANSAIPFIPQAGTTANNIVVSSIPALSWFGISPTDVGDNFFINFNYLGALTSLPAGSFDTSSISGVVGNNFFAGFNKQGVLTSLPAGSFNISGITSIGNSFFSQFNRVGALTSLPV